MIAEIAVAGILQPLHTVPGPGTRCRSRAKAVAIGIENIRSAVAVQIAQADAAAAVIFIGRAPDALRAELACALVFKIIDFLPLLGNESDNVGFVVAVVVGDTNVDGARELEQ